MNTITDITEVMLQNLKKKFDTINFCVYPDYEKINKAHIPLSTLELTSINHVASHSDLRNLELSFNLLLVYDDSTKGQLEIRDTALAIGSFLDNNSFSDKRFEKATIMASQPDNFSPMVDGYIVWEIEFNLTCTVGVTIYEPNSISPEFELEISEDAN